LGQILCEWVQTVDFYTVSERVGIKAFSMRTVLRFLQFGPLNAKARAKTQPPMQIHTLKRHLPAGFLGRVRFGIVAIAGDRPAGFDHKYRNDPHVAACQGRNKRLRD
jgi:hypothetical protein